MSPRRSLIASLAVMALSQAASLAPIAPLERLIETCGPPAKGMGKGHKQKARAATKKRGPKPKAKPRAAPMTQTRTAPSVEIVAALRNLLLMARTSGGTAGPDSGLMAACARAEQALTKPAEDTVEDLAALIHAYYMAEIGGLMHQAEHWAEHAKPLAVLHRLRMADALFQVAVMFDPGHRANGHPEPFGEMRRRLAAPPIKPPGRYPCSPDLHRYNDPRFVVAELDRLRSEERR